LLKDLTTHVSPVSIDMMINGILECGDPLIAHQHEGDAGIVPNPPFLIGESLK
jgi:hypothetical protein